MLTNPSIGDPFAAEKHWTSRVSCSIIAHARSLEIEPERCSTFAGWNKNFQISKSCAAAFLDIWKLQKKLNFRIVNIVAVNGETCIEQQCGDSIPP